MKLLILGARGQVGFELARSLAPLGDLVLATRDGALDSGGACIAIDLAQPEMLEATLQEQAPDIVINAAAYTAVDRAEDEPVLADQINHRAVGVLGTWAAQSHALIVHFSTDYVFDGSQLRAYREDDPRAPLGTYGRSKLDGENALRAAHCSHLIFRTAWVFAAHGKNFLRTMLRLGADRDELRVVADQRGAPTSARLIADVTALALARWIDADEPVRQSLTGTYHLTASGQCTWHDFASAIFAAAVRAQLLTRTPHVSAIASSEYPTKTQRPAFSVLDTRKMREAFQLHLPDWKQGLEAVIGEIAAAQTK